MKPVIRIKKSVLTIAKLMVELSPIETNGIGWSRCINPDTYEVCKIIPADYKGAPMPGYGLGDLPSGGSVTVDPMLKSKEIIKANEAGFQLGFHFHSHVNFSAFWSGTDRNLQRNWNGKYLCALVMNKAGEWKACIVEAFITGPETRDAEIKTYGKDLTCQQLSQWTEYLKQYYQYLSLTSEGKRESLTRNSLTRVSGSWDAAESEHRQ